MRVGVYVDGFNLYYGARGLCGRSTPGWRWLDLMSLARSLVVQRASWAQAIVENVTYCTARVSGADDSDAQREQDVYLRALRRTGSATCISYGRYVRRVTKAPLATKGADGKPVLASASWPINAQDRRGRGVTDALVMASVVRREEKGSDVNLASHLLIDVLTDVVDAAVVISNDSDLAYPIAFTKTRVPVGLVNPTSGLTGRRITDPDEGVGGHWSYRLRPSDLYAHQLPGTIDSTIRKPPSW